MNVSLWLTLLAVLISVPGTVLSILQIIEWYEIYKSKQQEK